MVCSLHYVKSRPKMITGLKIRKRGISLSYISLEIIILIRAKGRKK